MTSTGLIIGSCAYMAAERFSGGQVGPAADIYSLTCLLYECLTGRAPFEGSGDLRQLMSAHMFSPPPRPSIMRRGITRAFDDVVARGMAKKPSDRYRTAGELAKAAAAAAGSVEPVRPPLPAPSPPTSTRQFSAVYENPAGTGYTPYPPPPRRTAGAARGTDAEEPLRQVADGAGSSGDRAVRRGGGAVVDADLRWPRRRLSAADDAGGAAAGYDD